MNPTNELSVSAAPSGVAMLEKHVSPLVRQFLDYLKLEKHFSDYTVKSYGADLIQFGQFLSGQIGQRPVAPGQDSDERHIKCDTLTIREFLNYLYGQNYTKSTTRASWRRYGAFSSSWFAAGWSAPTRCRRSARPSRKSACPSAWTWNRFRSCWMPRAMPIFSAPAIKPCWKCSTAAAFASASWWSWRWRTWICRRESCASAARAARIGLRRSVARRSRRFSGISSCADRFALPGAGFASGLPEQARGIALDAIGTAEAGQISAVGRAGPGDQPAHFAAQLCHPPAEQRGRSAERAGIAGPPEPQHDADLHASDDAANEGCLRFGTSAGKGGFDSASCFAGGEWGESSDAVLSGDEGRVRIAPECSAVGGKMKAPTISVVGLFLRGVLS